MKVEANVGLMREILDNEVKFFVEKNNPMNVYAEFPTYDGARAFEPISSKRLDAFLGHQYRLESDERILPDFSELLAMEEQEARYTMKNAVYIQQRVAGKISSGNILYFLADDQWSSIMITKNGWRDGKSKKVRFRKSLFDLAQVRPQPGGDLLSLLRPYINMSDEDFKLFVVYIVQGFSRSSSHFAAVISSDKGTGKSTLTKVIRAIIDPTETGTTLLSNNESDLKTNLANSYVVCFDNTAALSAKISNILCAAITGSKEAKRKLYSDCDQIVLNLHNMVIINGIDIVPYKSDLAERSLLFELLPISKEQRKTDEDFWSSFQKDLPLILGSILDTLVKAIQLYPTIETTKLHRMADANREMLAIAAALGISQEDFQKLLFGNGEKLQKVYAQNNPFVDTVVSYVWKQGSLDMPAAKLYSCLVDTLVGRSSFFPDSPSSLSRRLNEEKDALEAEGISFSRYKKANANYIRLEKIAKSQQTKQQKDAEARRWELLDDASSEE